MAAFGLLGCTADPAAPSAPPPPVATPLQEIPSALPQPSALLDVLTRISDPAIPGADKLNLIEGATGADAAAMDGFTAALRDNRWAPLEFSVTGITASGREPGMVIADVTITPAAAAAAPFSFPMEFTPDDDSWHLSRHTADLLLAVGG